MLNQRDLLREAIGTFEQHLENTNEYFDNIRQIFKDTQKKILSKMSFKAC